MRKFLVTITVIAIIISVVGTGIVVFIESSSLSTPTDTPISTGQ